MCTKVAVKHQSWSSSSSHTHTHTKRASCKAYRRGITSLPFFKYLRIFTVRTSPIRPHGPLMVYTRRTKVVFNTTEFWMCRRQLSRPSGAGRWTAWERRPRPACILIVFLTHTHTHTYIYMSGCLSTKISTDWMQNNEYLYDRMCVCYDTLCATTTKTSTQNNSLVNV